MVLLYSYKYQKPNRDASHYCKLLAKVRVGFMKCVIQHKSYIISFCHTELCLGQDPFLSAEM